MYTALWIYLARKRADIPGEKTLAQEAGTNGDVIFDNARVEANVDFAVARAATSTLNDTDTTALEAIAQYRATVPPENRCWIIALGSEDAVLSVRNNSNPALPIQQMVDALAGEPTLWITPVLASATTEFTLDASTAYNRALLQIAATHPSIVVFDWQSIALQHLDQFQLDGTHYLRPLYDLFVQQVADEVSLVWELQE